MPILSRRRLLGLTLGLPLLGTRGTEGANWSVVGASQVSGVNLMRLLNTVQHRYRHTVSGKYMDLWSVPNSPICEQLLRPWSRPPVFDRSAGLIDHFEVRFRLANDGHSYQVVLVSRAHDVAFYSDESGVIYNGFVNTSEQIDDNPDLRADSGFTGRPISQAFVDGAQSAAGKSRVGVVAALLGGFIMPVLNAAGFEGQCCSGSGCSCGGSSCNCAPAACCDVGFGGDCNWCCSSNQSCSSSVPNGCGKPS
jgi:hypothetical protein